MTMLCTLIRGQMSYTFFSWGHMSSYVNCLGGQMSSYAIFHRGAHVRGGGGGMSYTQLKLVLTTFETHIFEGSIWFKSYLYSWSPTYAKLYSILSYSG